MTPAEKLTQILVTAFGGLPEEVRLEIIRTIEALEKASFIEGYAEGRVSAGRADTPDDDAVELIGKLFTVTKGIPNDTVVRELVERLYDAAYLEGRLAGGC